MKHTKILCLSPLREPASGHRGGGRHLLRPQPGAAGGGEGGGGGKTAGGTGGGRAVPHHVPPHDQGAPYRFCGNLPRGMPSISSGSTRSGTCRCASRAGATAPCCGTARSTGCFISMSKGERGETRRFHPSLPLRSISSSTIAPPSVSWRRVRPVRRNPMDS